jgi:O-antigen/teichoic acid export membrane protein
MKQLISPINKLVTDVVATATSRARLKSLLSIPLYSNAIYLVVANAANALLGFAFWIVAARLYTTEDVGLASATISAVFLLTMLANLGLGYGLIRFLPNAGRNTSNMINSCFTIGGLTSIVTSLIFMAGLGFWSPALLSIRSNPFYLIAFILFTIVSTLTSLAEQAFVAGRRTGFILAKNLIFNLLRFLLVVLLASFFHAFGIFASWGISVGVACLVSIPLFLPRVLSGYRPFFAINRGTLNAIFPFSLANYAGNLFWAAPAFVLPIMVVNLLGAEPNAYFYIAWAISGVLTMIPGAGSLSLFAEGSYEEDKLEQNLWRSLKMVFVILVPLAILVMVLADKVLLLFGSAYAENAATLLRILSIAALPLAINVVYLSIKRVEKKLKVIISLSASMAVVTLVLSFCLMPLIGINGVGIAWLSAQGIIALVIVAGSVKKQWLKGRPGQ